MPRACSVRWRRTANAWPTWPAYLEEPPHDHRPLKVDFTFTGRIDQAAAAAALAEQRGVDGMLVNEAKHDAFLQLGLAAGTTRRIDLASTVAIAFARNPMTVATAAYDVQRLSAGRAVIGLGSQIKPHITRRYSMPWSKPAARMGSSRVRCAPSGTAGRPATSSTSAATSTRIL